MKRPLAILAILLFICPCALGREIKVVSLAPSMTEILFAIGLDEKEIVGVTDYCEYPEAVKKILKVGSLTTVNIEKVVALQPDYVFTIGAENSYLNTRLRNIGLNIIVLNPRNTEEIFSAILKAGEILDRKERAKEVIAQMRLRLNKIKNKTGAIQNKKRVYVEIWDDPITSCGKGSFIDEIVTFAGGIDITGNIDALYPTVNQEFIIEQNPDVIILGYMARDQKNIIRNITNRFGWQSINAVKNKKIICDINPSLFLKPGPRIIDGIEQIYNKLYGDK